MNILGAPIHNYDQLHAVLRARAAEMALTREGIDHVSGLARGHAAKILGPGQVKRVGVVSLGAMLSALGIALVAVEDQEALDRFAPLVEKHRGVKPRHFDLTAEIERKARELLRARAVKAGRRSAGVRLANSTPEERSRSASVAATARWAKTKPAERRTAMAKLNSARKRKRA